VRIFNSPLTPDATCAAPVWTKNGHIVFGTFLRIARFHRAAIRCLRIGSLLLILGLTRFLTKKPPRAIRQDGAQGPRHFGGNALGENRPWRIVDVSGS
jgi:hypothetical protein